MFRQAQHDIIVERLTLYSGAITPSSVTLSVVEGSSGREYGRWVQAEPFLCVFDRLNMTFIIAEITLVISHKANTRRKIPSFVIQNKCVARREESPGREYEVKYKILRI